MSESVDADCLPHLLLPFDDTISFSFSLIRLSFSTQQTLNQFSNAFHSCRSLTDGVGLMGSGVGFGGAGVVDFVEVGVAGSLEA